MDELLKLLKKFFGYTSFRPLQAEVIQRILNKKDSLVLMPTGGGKSICYQLPAIYLPGTAIVISPLIALMKDQVGALITNGIPAAALNSTTPEDEKQNIKLFCMQGKIKLLYISPEKVRSEIDWLLPRLDISLIAIDEAHCISNWGHDFRPEYIQLSILKERFPNVPIVALTATADKFTRTDIIEQLKLSDPKIFITSFDRPNLSLCIRKGYNKANKLTAVINFIYTHKKQCGIIYCLKRNDTEELAEALTSYNIKAAAYHAGLPAEVREKAQDDFIKDHINVVCATVAFGMGIDKSNVRWVIHFNMPASIENYYQEIGRAGRDGAKSDTLLFYNLNDLVILNRFAEYSGQKEINIEKLNRMKRYCEADICRRRILLSYFGEEAEHDCGNCDVCKNPPQRFDGTILVQKALSAIVRAGEKIKTTTTINILLGSVNEEITKNGYDQLKTFGAGKDLSFNEWKDYLYQMVQLGYIEINYIHKNCFKVTPLGSKVLYGDMKVQLTLSNKSNEEVAHIKKRNFKAQPIRPLRSVSEEETLLDSLNQLRKQIAEREQQPPYVIFSDDTIEDIVEKRPITLDQFSKIHGVGEIKLNKYGKVFVSLVRFILKLPKEN